jgi:hypothetical protein
MQTSELVRLVVQAVPQVKPHLNGKAMAFVYHIDPAYKTQDYFEAAVERLVNDVYGGYMGGDFIDIMDSLISGQLYDAYVQAWEEDNNTLPLPDFLQEALDQAVVAQQDFVQGYYNDIVDARVDKTPIDPLLARAQLWAGNWQTQHNNAQVLIVANKGGRMMWIEGDTKEKCNECVSLDGIVAYASEWQQAGVQPRNAPNDALGCGGWNCECTLESTDQRRSPDALARIMAVAVAKIGL